MKRRTFVKGMLAGAISTGGTVSWAQQAYPSRPVRIIVAVPAGGSIDLVARMVGLRLTEALGQTFLVDNRPGGAGIIGTDLAAKAAPDGYTLTMAPAAFLSSHPSTFAKLPYDPVRDFTPVINVVIQPSVLVVHPSAPSKTVKELAAFAKANPGKLNYGSGGEGSPHHLSGVMFSSTTETKMVHVPYKGGAPATTALLGGQEVQFGFVGMGPIIPHVKAGRVRALAISTAKRSAAVPEVPTLQEQGVADFDTSIWFAFVVPAKTPKGVVDKLNAEIGRILRGTDAREYLIGTGVEVTPGSPGELARFIRSETDKYRKIIQTSGTRLD